MGNKKDNKTVVEKVEVVETPTEAPVEVEEVVSEEQDKVKTFKCVVNRKVIRVYDTETHGKNAEKLAKQYCSHKGCEVLKA